MIRAGSLLVALVCSACQDARQCRADVASAQEVVSAVDSKSIESVTAAEKALEKAIAKCDEAGLGTERNALVEAKNQISAHRALLERKAATKKQAPTAEELDKLVKDGDPTCPAGQAYKQRGTTANIRCTGPQLTDMGMQAVADYYSTRRFKVEKTDAPPRVRAEYGAELYVFTYDEPNDSAGAKCIELYPAPGVRWQEAVSRASGVPLDRVKPGKPVKVARGELALVADDAAQKQTAKLGDCGASAAAP